MGNRPINTGRPSARPSQALGSHFSSKIASLALLGLVWKRPAQGARPVLLALGKTTVKGENNKLKWKHQSNGLMIAWWNFWGGHKLHCNPFSQSSFKSLFSFLREDRGRRPYKASLNKIKPLKILNFKVPQKINNLLCL